MTEPDDVPAPPSPPSAPSPPSKPSPPRPPKRQANWLARLVGVLVGLLSLVAGYVVATAFLPRWWAQRVAQASDGRFTSGIGFGLIVGALFTALPLLALGAATRRGRAWSTRAALCVVALLLAVPNLITLGIVYGNGSAAHAGERILDVEAPGFRGATLVGAVLGTLLTLGYWLLMASRRRGKRQIAELKGRLAARDPQP